MTFNLPTENSDVCLDFNLDIDDPIGGAISNSTGNAITTEIGDCINFEGCIEPNADNYISYAIFDDGSCSCYGDDCLDCAGNVSGNAVVNGCSTCICNGEIAQDGYTCEESEDCTRL